MRIASLLLACSACGRIAFDPLGDGGRNGNGSGSGSGGATGDASMIICPVVANCPEKSIGIDNTSSASDSVQTMFDHGFSAAPCSNNGASNPETTWLVTPSTAGSYKLSTSPASLSVYVQEQCCGGPVVLCGASTLTISRAAGQKFVVVVEGQINQLQSLSVQGM